MLALCYLRLCLHSPTPSRGLIQMLCNFQTAASGSIHEVKAALRFFTRCTAYNLPSNNLEVVFHEVHQISPQIHILHLRKYAARSHGFDIVMVDKRVHNKCIVFHCLLNNVMDLVYLGDKPTGQEVVEVSNSLSKFLFDVPTVKGLRIPVVNVGTKIKGIVIDTLKEHLAPQKFLPVSYHTFRMI